MLGSTNATINYITGGGGDSVTAINNTGETLAVGDKVWLNKHNWGEMEVCQQINSGSREAYKCFFFEGNDAYDYNLSTGLLEKYAYNVSDKAWVQNSLWTSKVSINSYSGIKQVEDKIIAYGISTGNWGSSTIGNIILNSSIAVPFTGIYLGDELLYRPYDNTLCAVNTNTGEVGEVYYTFTLPKTGSALRDGNILLITTFSGYYFYDITDLTNPILLKSATNMTYLIYDMTGLTPGSYLFAYSGTIIGGGYYNPRQLLIYQINENYELVAADGLPGTLRNIIGTTASMTFINNILCVGTGTNVYAYQWVNNEFTDLNISLDMSNFTTNKYTNYPYIFYVSKDLTTATIGCRVQSSTYVYTSIYLFKLTTTSDEWFAEGLNQRTPYSLSGFVREVNEENVMVDTVLPPVKTLTLNFNVEPDVVELTGGTDE